MRRFRTAIIVTLVLLAVAVGAVWSLRGPDMPLTKRARKVADIAVIKPRNMDVYSWINRRELLCFREDASGFDGRPINGLIVRDVVSGAERHFSQLERIFFQGVGHGVSGFDVSPDGRWLLWKADGQVRATRLDGSRDLRWPEPSFDFVPLVDSSTLRWLADGSGWAVLTLGQCAINSLEDQAPSQPYRIPSLTSVEWSLTPTVLPTREVLVNDPLRRAASSLDVFRFPVLRDQPPATRPRSLRGPAGTLRGYLCFSYDGRRMAWVLTMNRRSSFPSWLRRLLPFVKTGDGWVQSVWVSGLDGRHPKELGWVPTKPSDEPLHDVRWLPDNRTLSFEHNNALWTIGAD